MAFPQLIKVASIMLVLSLLFGCRRNYLFEYESQDVPLAIGGRIEFKLMGTSADSTVKGKPVRVVSKPYSLVVRAVSDNQAWVSTELLGLQLLQQPAGAAVFKSPAAESAVQGKDLEGHAICGFSFGDLAIDYHDYRVVGRVVLRDKQGRPLGEQQIDVTLKRRHEVKRSSDTSDSIMGI